MAIHETSASCSFDGETCIDDLPDECLLIIVNFINDRDDQDAFGLTCHRWLRIQSGLRHAIKISCLHAQEASEVKYAFIRKLFDRFPAIHTFSFSGWHEAPDSALAMLEFVGSNLKNLSLDSCFGVTNKGLTHIGRGCSALSSLSICRCDIDDAGMEYIAEGCPNLETINISYCQRVTDTGIGLLSEGCQRLRIVNISNCIKVQGQGFKNSSSLQFLEAEACRLSDDGLGETIRAGTLQYLNLSHIRNGANLGPRGLRSIGLSCCNLQFLYLRMCRALENLAVVEISKGCPILKEWNIAVCQQVSVAGWNAVAKNCKNLEILHVNRCRWFCNDSMLFLRDGCPKLSNLYLSGCPNLAAITIEFFKQARSNVRILPYECMPNEPYVDRFLNI